VCMKFSLPGAGFQVETPTRTVTCPGPPPLLIIFIPLGGAASDALHTHRVLKQFQPGDGWQRMATDGRGIDQGTQGV
jgi:hypothetical protein